MLGAADDGLASGVFRRYRRCGAEARLACGVAALFALIGCAPRGPSLIDSGSDAGVSDAMTPPTDSCVGAPVSLRCPLCVPGTLSCASDGMSTVQCAADGLSYMPGSACMQGELCNAGRCVDPCPAAAAASDYRGCEFYATNTLNSGLGHFIPGQSRDEFPYALVVSNSWPVATQVTVDGGNLPATLVYTVGPNDATVIDLPWNLDLAEGTSSINPVSSFVANGAFHVQSTLPVAIYQFNPINYDAYHECLGQLCYSFTNDASLLLPVVALGTQYVALSRATIRVEEHEFTSWTAFSGFVTIVGTSDTPTNVTLTLRGATLAGANGIAAGNVGDVQHWQLNRGDVIQLVSSRGASPVCPASMVELEPIHQDRFCPPQPDEDLTGSVIESDQPVAVFSGHDCAFVPIYDRTACDHLEEQLFPVQALGQTYVVARTPPVADEPNYIRVVAAHANTMVNVMPSSVQAPFTLANAGDWLEFVQDEAVQITATQPVSVAQFLVGANYNVADTITQNGDPDLVQIVPTGQFRNEYSFYTASDFQGTNAIMVVSHGQTLVFDGQPITDPPAHTIGDFDVYYRQQLQGPHVVRAASPSATFGLTVSGLDMYCSYTYPGGLNLLSISPPL